PPPAAVATEQGEGDINYADAASSASRRAMMSLYWASVPKPSAPSAPAAPVSPFGPCGPSGPSGPRGPSSPGSPCSPLSPLSPFAALAAPAASMRFSSAAVIGVPPALPSAHLSGSNAISYLLDRHCRDRCYHPASSFPEPPAATPP